ncbi:alcohol acetyltransferase [Limtongia smithiae]|uniref:alcohol acetyltransferase n=1 Tax=Limtongia smithiae TaxID=1125753 RepID=UPI0034CE58A8
MAATQESRPLGTFERYFYERNLQSLYQSVVIWIDLAAPITPARLHRALRYLLAHAGQERSALWAYVVGAETDAPRLAMLPQIDVADIVSFIGDDEVDEKVAFERFLVRLSETPIAYDVPKMPLWRVVVWKDKSVCFAFDHMPFDGTSGALFQVAFADALAATADDADVDKTIVERDPAMKLFPCMEDAVVVSPPVVYLLRALLSEFGPGWPKWLKRPTRTPEMFGGLTKDVSGVVMHVITFDAAQTSAMITACRAHNTTLTALMHTFILVAMSSAFPDAPGFATTIPINARRFASSDISNMMGVYVSKFGETLPSMDSSVTSVWQEATRLAVELRAGTNRATCYLIGALKYVGDVRKWLAEKVASGGLRDSEMELSNIGAYRFAPAAGVVGLGFAQPHGVVQPPVKFNSAGVVGGRVTLTMTCTDRIVGEGKGAVLYTAFMDVANALLSTLEADKPAA